MAGTIHTSMNKQTLLMSLNRFVCLLLVILAGQLTWAQQGEGLRALGARPIPGAARAKDNVQRVFRYENTVQELPLVDDFSIDRARKLNALATDAGVTLSETIYRIEVGGTSTPDMKYNTDTSFIYTIDASDPPITTRAALPSQMATIRDLTVEPPTSMIVEVWPAYDLLDSIAFPPLDTLFTLEPAYTQDSLLVYNVPPDPRTYRMGNDEVPLILWQDDDVYVNGTYPIDPPTIGVATFDGLARTGYPYDFQTYTSYGRADHLTSVDINLERPASDSIYLSFFYQAQGLSGDAEAQAQDSLLLEFYAPVEQTWYPAWGIPYATPGPFQQVLVPVKELRYLHPGFQFRFVNKATLSGSFDHWHLDYVRLAAQRSFDDERIVDMAYVYPESSILQTYTSIPFNRFYEAPESNMALNVEETIKNLDVQDRFIRYGMLVRSDNAGTEVDQENGINTSGNASSSFTTQNPINSGGAPFVLDTAGLVDAAFWEVVFHSQTQPDLIQYNDSISFVQEVSNYYAYDDGSAEAAYFLQTAGAKLAYRYDLLGADSLRAIRIYFNPQANAPPDAPPMQGSFLCTVWKSLEPEVIQHQNFSFSSPRYRVDGINKYVEYELDSAIRVEGTIYIGWVQTNATRMNIGFDKNRDNSSKIYFKTGTSWANTSFAGSLMMRPVMIATVDPWASISEEQAAPGGLVLYPNPTNDGFRIRLETEVPYRSTVECTDATGRVVLSNSISEGTVISTSALANGLYMVRVVGPDSATLAQGRLMVQH